MRSLAYRKLSARWIPHVLTPENKRVSSQYSKALLKIDKLLDPNRLDEIVTGDETWVYEPPRKAEY